MSDNKNTSDEVYIENDESNPQDSSTLTHKTEVYTETLHKTAKKIRKTLPKPTRYERAAIIGVRATQIAHGSEPNTDITGMTDPYEMAEKEFNDGKSPLIIERRLPGGEVERVRLSELIQ